MSIEKEQQNNLLLKVSKLIENEDHKNLIKLISKLHIADIADIVKELERSELIYLFNILDNKTSSLLLIEIEEDLRKIILDSCSSKEIATQIIGHLESDDATDVLSELSNKKQEEILSLLNNNDHANDISDLLNYNDDSAGGLMATELIKVNENWNTLMCLKEMKKQASHVNQVHTIYVVNNQNILLGSLSLKKLLLTETESPIRDLANTDIVSVMDTEKSEVVINVMNKYDLIVLPVTNKKGLLLGRITIDDVMDVVKEEAEKDYQMASGISEDVELSDNIFQLTRARLPWLLIGLLGGILGAKIIGIFNISENLDLALFIPLIAAMGGNVGIQSAAIIVQGISNNTISHHKILNKLLKELKVALLNGLICSIIIFICTYFLNFRFDISITVSISLFSVIIFAALFGTFVPLTLNRYRIDPALATGPFITTVNDILGLYIYLLIGQAIL